MAHGLEPAAPAFAPVVAAGSVARVAVVPAVADAVLGPAVAAVAAAPVVAVDDAHVAGNASVVAAAAEADSALDGGGEEVVTFGAFVAEAAFALEVVIRNASEFGVALVAAGS